MPAHRKPKKLLLLTGTLDQRRHGKAEQIFELPPGVPVPPEWLEGHALEEWNRICSDPVMQKVLSPLDGGILLAHAVAYQELVLRATGVREGGVRPGDVTMLASTSAKLGLSPSDRARLQLPEVPKANRWEKFKQPA